MEGSPDRESISRRTHGFSRSRCIVFSWRTDKELAIAGSFGAVLFDKLHLHGLVEQGNQERALLRGQGDGHGSPSELNGFARRKVGNPRDRDAADRFALLSCSGIRFASINGGQLRKDAIDKKGVHHVSGSNHPPSDRLLGQFPICSAHGVRARPGLRSQATDPRSRRCRSDHSLYGEGTIFLDWEDSCLPRRKNAWMLSHEMPDDTIHADRRLMEGDASETILRVAWPKHRLARSNRHGDSRQERPRTAADGKRRRRGQSARPSARF